MGRKDDLELMLTGH